MPGVPIIDLGDSDAAAARAIDSACRDTGFFCVIGHGVSTDLIDSLQRSARSLFALSPAAKERVAMSVGGRAWRGWFPLGGELTNGIPDRKEGFYFGQELPPTDQRVRDGWALHGANVFPQELPELRRVVLAWLDEMTRVGHTVLGLVGLGLGLPLDWFRKHLTNDPTILFRIFHYPVDGPGQWGVAEHTDYGLLTLLLQDDCGGLQVNGSAGWVDVAPVANTFVCNIGDMLERMTGGRYRSTAHRVRNTSGRDRLSFPFFFDPSWYARVPILALDHPPDDSPDGSSTNRWDGQNVFDFDGTYGDYLVAKVGRVFPDLVHVI